MATFQEYLKSKRIDPEAFQQHEASTFERCSNEFAALGSKAFDLQKKFFLNNWRKQWPFSPPEPAPAAAKPSARPRPVRKKPTTK